MTSSYTHKPLVLFEIETLPSQQEYTDSSTTTVDIIVHNNNSTSHAHRQIRNTVGRRLHILEGLQRSAPEHKNIMEELRQVFLDFTSFGAGKAGSSEMDSAKFVKLAKVCNY